MKHLTLADKALLLLCIKTTGSSPLHRGGDGAKADAQVLAGLADVTEEQAEAAIDDCERHGWMQRIKPAEVKAEAERLQHPDLYAWLGLDELGSGRVGLKAALVPAGFIPLVACDFDRHKIQIEPVLGQLQEQASAFNVTIRLVRYTPAKAVIELRPVKTERKGG